MATTFSNSERQHRRSSSQANNPHETFSRYEEHPFRQVHDRDVPFENAPLYGDQSPHIKPPISRKQKSKEDVLKNVLSQQKKLEDTVQKALSGNGQGGAFAGHPDCYDFDPSAGQSNVQRHGSKRPAYSLAGPRGPPPSDQYYAYRDPDYEEPPQDDVKPIWGLAKPLPRVPRNKKSKKGKSQRKPQRGTQDSLSQSQMQKSKHPKGQVRKCPDSNYLSFQD